MAPIGRRPHLLIPYEASNGDGRLWSALCPPKSGTTLCPILHIGPALQVLVKKGPLGIHLLLKGDPNQTGNLHYGNFGDGEP